MSEHEVAVRDDRPEEIESVEVIERGSEDLLRFSRDLSIAYSFCTSLVQTQFVPGQYQNNPGNAAAAVMTARGVGITDPLAALRSIDIIQGTPAFRANTLRALVQREGHEIWVEEASSQRAVVKGKRRGSDRVEVSMWDMDRARQMKLAGKDNWQKQPQAMLVARATSEVARLIAADVILGLYAAEELADGVVPAQVAEVAVEKPKRRVARRKKAEQVEAPESPEKPGEANGEPAEQVSDDAEPVTEPVEPEAAEAPVEDEPPVDEEQVQSELADWGEVPEGWDS